METIITTAQGDNLTTKGKTCTFCDQPAEALFGVIAGKKWNGEVLRSFPTCSVHLECLNSLLSGDYDIDKINLDSLRKPSTSLRFRG